MERVRQHGSKSGKAIGRPSISDRTRARIVEMLPDDATPHDYRALMRRLGITRQVLVQPSAYGADNRCLLDALAAFGGKHARSRWLIWGSLTRC
jgi:predicted TIM-barrel fold metal-dependent hydrolase